MTKSIQFLSLPVHAYFRIPGYDDMFQKVDASTAVDEGCGFLTKPVRFAHKYSKITIDPMTWVNPN